MIIHNRYANLYAMIVCNNNSVVFINNTG